ncbi:MAG: pyridoxine 5'-phosphate synthase [Planctomycetes bacterium]|nr:pyridoxine 5'-phosphate synthase [Planctomycetota bacterium]
MCHHSTPLYSDHFPPQSRLHDRLAPTSRGLPFGSEPQGRRQPARINIQCILTPSSSTTGSCATTLEQCARTPDHCSRAVAHPIVCHGPPRRIGRAVAHDRIAEFIDTGPGRDGVLPSVQPFLAVKLRREGDWALARSRLGLVIKEVRSPGVRVSLFMDAGTTEMELAKKIGADRIELYTEPYASAHRDGNAGAELSRFRCAAEAATQAGLGINAGHDLNLDNLKDFIAQVPGILEVSIGHALISDALHMGMDATVKKYLHALSS